MGRFLRRFFRLAFHVAAGFSALALVSCLILWPLSYRRSVEVGYDTLNADSYALVSQQGRFHTIQCTPSWLEPGFKLGIRPVDPGKPAGWSYTDWDHTTGSTHWKIDRVLGCEWAVAPVTWWLQIPFSYLTLLAAILPAFWLRSFLRRRRQARLARRGFPVEPAA